MASLITMENKDKWVFIRLVYKDGTSRYLAERARWVRYLKYKHTTLGRPYKIYAPEWLKTECDGDLWKVFMYTIHPYSNHPVIWV